MNGMTSTGEPRSDYGRIFKFGVFLTSSGPKPTRHSFSGAECGAFGKLALSQSILHMTLSHYITTIYFQSLNSYFHLCLIIPLLGLNLLLCMFGRFE